MNGIEHKTPLSAEIPYFLDLKRLNAMVADKGCTVKEARTMLYSMWQKDKPDA